jgi:uncharacterized membrane protein YidH (DUF202 family)
MSSAEVRRRLLAAISIPCLIGAGLLAWQAYAALTGRAPSLPTWQIYLYFAIALVLMILFFAGVRARHRPLNNHGTPPPEP